MRLAGIDLGTSAARVALSGDEGVRVLSLSAPARPTGASACPDADALFGAELSLLETGGPISAAVLAVGADKDPAERAALRDAAHRHGLTRVRLVAAPVAAALASVRQGGVSGRLLVLDLGETGLSVALLSVNLPRVDVIGLAHTDEVGGQRLDQVVAAQLAELAGPDATPELRRAAATAARGARHDLTDHFEARITLEVTGTPRRVVKLSRDQFEQRARSLFARAEPTIRGVLSEALLRPEDLDHVLLVGGCASMPLARRFATEVTGRRVRVPEVPETWAAVGAALYGQALWGGAEPLLLTPALSHGIWVAGLQDAADLLLPRNCALPAHAICSRPADLELRLEGESGAQGAEQSTGAQPLFLRAAVEGCGDAPIEWTVTADSDGILTAEPSPWPEGWRPDAAPGALAPSPEATARQRVTLRAALAAQIALVGRLGARGDTLREMPFAAIGAALDAGDVATARAGIAGVDDALTRLALAGIAPRTETSPGD